MIDYKKLSSMRIKPITRRAIAVDKADTNKSGQPEVLLIKYLIYFLALVSLYYNFVEITFVSSPSHFTNN